MKTERLKVANDQIFFCFYDFCYCQWLLLLNILLVFHITVKNICQYILVFGLGKSSC